jgi:hypothetical protein
MRVKCYRARLEGAASAKPGKAGPHLGAGIGFGIAIGIGHIVENIFLNVYAISDCDSETRAAT